MSKRLLPLLSLSIVLSLPCLAAAQADIPADCRIPNRPPGRCGWCALETLARHQHIKTLYGIVDTQDCQCCPADLEEFLKQYKIAYHCQQRGENDQTLLRKTVHDHCGVVIGFREPQPGAGGHIVTLIDITDNEVRLIDPNDQDKRTRTMPLERFLYWWDGFALTLDRVEKTAKK